MEEAGDSISQRIMQEVLLFSIVIGTASESRASKGVPFLINRISAPESILPPIDWLTWVVRVNTAKKENSITM